MLLDKKFLNNIKFFIQIPKSHIKIYKKKYLDYLDNTRCIFFSLKIISTISYMIWSFQGLVQALFKRFYNIIIMFFIPHLISRDQHQRYNLSYFLSHKMSLKKFVLPNKKNLISQFYFNSLINPHSIKKIICYTTRWNSRNCHQIKYILLV